MTSHRPQPGAKARNRCRRRSPGLRAALLVAIAGLGLALAGCAMPVPQVRLPGKLVATSTAISAPPPMTPRQQVLAALIGYTTALGQADKSRSSAVARELLRPFLAAGRIAGLVQAMEAIWARGESFTGQDILHVSSISVVRQHAFVHDCDNTSGMALVNVATGHIVPGSSGTSRANLVTRLDLISGDWLVQFQLLEDLPCVA
jgi:hypothetical protein